MSPYVCDCTNVVYMFCVYCIYYYVNKFEARSLFSTSHLDNLVQPSEEDVSSHRAVDVDSKLSNGTPAMSSTLNDTNTRDNNDRKAVATRRLISFVDYSQFCMFSRETSHKPARNNPDVVKEENTTQSKPPQVETKMKDDSRRRSNKYVPMHIHDIYIGHVPQTFTEDAVHSFLRDINIKHIIRVSKLLTIDKHAGFRVIIGDEDIGNTVYGTKKIHRDAVTMTFKEFRCNTDTHHRYRGRHNRDQNDTYQTKKIQDLSNNRHTQVDDSSINNNYIGKSVTFSRSRYIKRSRPNDKFGRTHNMYKDHLQRQAPVDTSCNQRQHITANKKLLESTTTQKPLSSSVSAQSKPHILSDMNGIMPNQLPRRTLPSDVLIQEQQPKRPTSGATSTYIQQPEEPLMSVTFERTQTSPPTGAQQQRCSPSHTSVETHPVKRCLPGSGVSTQTPQSQGPHANDALLSRRLQGSLPTAVLENSQPMQRNTYPQFLPTQRAAPCDVSQAAGVPVASAPCT